MPKKHLCEGCGRNDVAEDELLCDECLEEVPNIIQSMAAERIKAKQAPPKGKFGNCNTCGKPFNKRFESISHVCKLTNKEE